MRHFHAAAALALSFVVIGPARATPPDGEVTYAIYREGGQIGTQTVSFRQSGARMEVRHRVEIRVRVLGLQVFHYDLTARETWEEDRLVALSSRTDRNGTSLSISARAEEGGLSLRRANGQRLSLPIEAIPADPHGHPPRAGVVSMIEAEDGAVHRVRVTGPRHQVIDVSGAAIPTQRYDMTGGHRGTLWYDASGLLVRKDIVAPDGSNIITVMVR